MTGAGGERALDRRLSVLHEQYRWAVNAAVGRGVDDEVLAAMADEYADAALRALSEVLAPEP